MAENVNQEEFDFSKIEDDKMMSYLSEKSGRDIKSWDDLKIKEVEREFASEELKTLDKYVRETGRGVSDYVKLHKDWTKVEENKLVEDYLRSMNPNFSDQEIKELFELSYKEKSINEEEMDDEKVSLLKDENKKRALEKKKCVREALQYFQEQQKKYETPTDSKANELKEGEKAWKEAMGKAIDGISSIEFGDFKYDLSAKSKYAQLADMSQLMGMFKDEKGFTDFNRLAKTIIIGLESENIIAEHSNFVKANAKEEIMKQRSNASSGNSHELDKEDWEIVKKENLKKIKGL